MRCTKTRRSLRGTLESSECLLDASWAASHPVSCFRGSCWGHTIRFLVWVRHFYTSVVSSRMATPLQRRPRGMPNALPPRSVLAQHALLRGHPPVQWMAAALRQESASRLHPTGVCGSELSPSAAKWWSGQPRRKGALASGLQRSRSGTEQSVGTLSRCLLRSASRHHEKVTPDVSSTRQGMHQDGPLVPLQRRRRPDSSAGAADC